MPAISVSNHRLLSWLSGKESTCQCRRRRFNPWVGKMPWRGKWQSTLVFLPGKSNGQRSLGGYGPHCSKTVIRDLMTKPQQISNQRILQPSSHHITATPMVSPEGIQDRNTVSIINRPCSNPLPFLPSGSRGTYQRNDFREPRRLHLLIYKKH